MNTRLVSKPFVFILAIALLAGALVLTAGVNAQTPQPETPAEAAAPESPDAPSSLLFSYQGYLEDSGGNPVTGSVPMTFKFYDVPSGGTACWTETHSAVDVQEGIFNVLLGQITAMDTNCLTGDVYLELVVDGETLAPREVMASAFYTPESGSLTADARTRGNMTIPGLLTIHQGWGDWLRLEQDAGGYWIIHNPQSQDRLLVGHQDSSGNYLWNYLTIMENGNVGIGTTTPDHRLEVQGGNIEIQNDDADNYIRFHDPGNRWYTMGIRQSDGKFYINYGGSLGETTDGIIINSNGNVGIGTTNPDSRLTVSGGGMTVNNDTNGTNLLINNARDVDNTNGAKGGLRLVNGGDPSDWLGIDSNEITAYGSRLLLQVSGATQGVYIGTNLDVAGSVTCGAYIESNLQTPEEQQAESIERFTEGDVLCWSPENDRLEKCVAANDRLVMAVASPDGKPIVIGAEVIKVIGPVQAGDILVSSDVPGYAMVNNDPAPGTVIAQALEDFEGEQGIIKAMIRKW